MLCKDASCDNIIHLQLYLNLMTKSNSALPCPSSVNVKEPWENVHVWLIEMSDSKIMAT